MYPILFEFGPITVFSLWLFIAIGFAIGGYYFVRLAKRSRIKFALLADHSVAIAVWTLISARIFFIAFHADLYFYRFDFKNFLNLFALWDKGLSFFGAVLGWFAGTVYFAKKRRESAASLIDTILPALFIGMILGNIGAFLDGINYGTPTNLPWGVTFQSTNVKYITPIHPTQLYSAAAAGIISIALIRLLGYLRGRLPGFATEIAAFVFSFFKFFEEFFRGDETIMIAFVRLPQLAAFAGIFIAGYFLYNRYTNRKGTDPDRILKKMTTLSFFRKLKKTNSSEMKAQMSQGSA